MSHAWHRWGRSEECDVRTSKRADKFAKNVDRT